ncbi:hypothetical protein MBEHAL_2520 [Halarchaeum acidiphilum MH1-52-1]|uniref:Fumarylacetoacetate hydrolase family protein n=1 Tax=Halarchaeum acidiphilum MH1-52-1 TaxID=1261545 RepID=U2YXI5_9EURY|nr:hypothetical protein MBEHAL_2520 [Halarchaeum acidiphilum MH1-52-1]
MTRLARTADGEALIGGDDGFVPLSAAEPGVETVADALSLAADGTLAAGAGSTRPVPDDHLRFARPLASFGKLWGIGLNYAEHATDLTRTARTSRRAS